ncbi:MAG: class IV adenylate cyclase [Pirellulales bacterium]
MNVGVAGMLEVEQKYRVTDTTAIEARLTTLGVVWHPPIEQVDRYYNHPARDFAVTDEALRLRRVGPDNRITYKGPKLDAATKTRREIELPLAAGIERPDQYDELLVALGFRPNREVAKTRLPGELRYAGRTIEIALDRIAELGTFVELETTADQAELPAARDAILRLAAELGLADVERRSYLELLLEHEA